MSEGGFSRSPDGKRNDSENDTCVRFQGLLQREKGPEAQSLDQIVQQKNVPNNQQEAFRTGFSEGFMRSQAFTQRTQGVCPPPHASPPPPHHRPQKVRITFTLTSLLHRLAEENQAGPAGPLPSGPLWSVQNPVSLW